MRLFLIIVREIMVTLLIFLTLTGGVIFTTLKRNGEDKIVMEKIRVQLGDVAKDTITGFKGVVVGITKWLHGCERISIQPRGLKDGKPVEAQSFDEPQVVVVQAKKHKGTDGTGGPAPEPARRAEPGRGR